MESFAKGMYKLGEVILYAFVSIFYSSLILLPIFLLNLFLTENISKYLVLFVPLSGLIGFALERQANSFTATFVNDKKTLASYFKETFDENGLSKYLLYVLLFSLYFYADSSLRIISSTNGIIGILTIILLYFYRGIIFYTILQTSHRKYMGIIQTIKNSLILTYRYFFYSIIVYLVWELFERLIINNNFWLLIFILIFAAMVNTINEYTIKKL
ncbi:hypothetical protein JNO63_03160 [Anaerococcus sp. mt242]|uniref:hypothetical protein n=1 Tax=Anaerococcus sp. mt242 TaxID=2661917 RepID=UPI001932D707|nr:hypothetical protein [Anaerococcus sp. mt242]MBM0046084.1 hypothetical protein [Anaerococcus sp. mt242]